MGCSASSPHKDYHLGLERPKEQCRCNCHQNGGGTAGTRSQRAPLGPDMDTIKEDPRIPLSGRQIFLIRRSWKGISRTLCETGINMFLSLFEKNEEVLSFFQSLKGVRNLHELRSSKTLEHHVRGVMLTIDEAITNMDDPDTIIYMLLTVGKSHTRFEGYNPQVFWLIRDPFLLAVRDTLGDRYTAHVEHIYKKAIDFILTTMVCGFTGKAPNGSTEALAPQTNGHDHPPDNSHHPHPSPQQPESQNHPQNSQVQQQQQPALLEGKSPPGKNDVIASVQNGSVQKPRVTRN